MIFDALKVMGIGMGSVFVVLAAFYGIILLLRKAFPAKDGDEGNT